MVKIIIKSKSKKCDGQIAWYIENIKLKDRFIMKRIGTSVNLSKDKKQLIINLDQINLKALTSIRNNPALRELYERDVKTKGIEDYKATLLELGLKENIDYDMEVN